MSRPHIPKRDINAISDLPSPPDWFNKTQLAIYYELGAKVVNLKIWANSDFDAFCILVDNLANYQEAATIVAKEGVLTTGRDGNLVRHPASIVRSACFNIIQPLLIQFALTPSSRAAMGVSTSEKDDPIGAYLTGAVVAQPKHLN